MVEASAPIDFRLFQPSFGGWNKHSKLLLFIPTFDHIIVVEVCYLVVEANTPIGFCPFQNHL